MDDGAKENLSQKQRRRTYRTVHRTAYVLVLFVWVFRSQSQMPSSAVPPMQMQWTEKKKHWMDGRAFIDMFFLLCSVVEWIGNDNGSRFQTLPTRAAIARHALMRRGPACDFQFP